MKSITLNSIIALLVVTFIMPVSAIFVTNGVISDAHAAREERRDDRKKSNRRDSKDGRNDNRSDNRRDNRSYDRKDDRRADRKFDRRDDRRDGRGYEYRNGHKLVVVAPRRRHFRNIIVVRPYGHAYLGYGRYRTDNDAWKWLAFTAITLKILDNINEDAQREHEAAQIKATEAKVGEKITWSTPEANGYVVTTKQGKSESGKLCREFQQSVSIGGKTENAYGTACLQDDGAWKIES